MNPIKTISTLFAAGLLIMIAVVAMAVSSNSYESTETNKVEDAQVIIYGTPQCHYCKKTRKLLSLNNITYYEYDISKNREAYNTFQRLEGRGTPLIIIGETVIKGYNEPLIKELLNISENQAQTSS